jgi:hypothetical protein
MRLELVAGLGFALAVAAPAFAAQSGLRVATQTTLTAETRGQGGRTQVILGVTVTGEDRLPGAGVIAISDFGRQLAGAALDAQGQATLLLALPAGDHALSAIYSGDDTHGGSVSQPARVRAEATTTPDFQISVAPATLSLVPGQSGTVTASVTPENSSALTAPMFVTLSCSGLPDQSSCNFTPENIEILPNATAAIPSTVVILTQHAEGSIGRPELNGISLAFLLPGALGLGGLAWSIRRRPWLQRLSLLALVALVSLLGATACNARYDYYNHGPPPNPATPAGTYTVHVSAQSSDGVTATTHTTTLVFTVK